ncbi:hypothetical protein HH310_27435 [Actinoplanes sp. TBRC 11911]|nr:hypothetical protein [Actinoplanes sp. TBRC 11911]
MVFVPARPRFGRLRPALGAALLVALCLTLTGGTSIPAVNSPAFLIAGMSDIPSPPRGTSWSPAPVTANGLSVLAAADGQTLELHTAAGDRTFLPGVNLSPGTPGGSPISAAQYRAWFAAMTWLGIRVVRIYSVHPPEFYQQLAEYNRTNPDQPLYFMQGVEQRGDQSFQRAVRDTATAVAGEHGAWDTDANPWLAGWIIGSEPDPRTTIPAAKPADGKYFRSTEGASPTERWLATRMDELAGLQAKRGYSQPIAFVNWATTDPLRHPDEPLEQEDLLQLDANHVRPTPQWPAGTFASYHAYPYYPDFLRFEPGLVNTGDPYAGYLAALRRHHRDMPTLITEFGVPSSLGSAHDGPLGRNQGGLAEQAAMRIDADLLRIIGREGLAGGFLAGWADDWNRSTWNTVGHQVDTRRSMWHDPLTNEQYFGLLSMDPADDDAPGRQLFDADAAWPATKVTARTDAAYLHLRIKLADSPPTTLLIGFDVLPELTGPPMAGSADRRPDAAFALNLAGHDGQAYLRNQLDPVRLDVGVPASARGPAPEGWKPFELLMGRAMTIPTSKIEVPVALQNPGRLEYGDWRSGASLALWHRDDDTVDVRVPWAMLGFADPSTHRVGVPAKGRLTTKVSPGVTVSLTASGTEQAIGQVTWESWNRPQYIERLKQGAGQFRDAALAQTSD